VSLATVADHVAQQKRSEIMRAVRRKDTAPELVVRKAAHGLGLRFRLQGRQLPGRPDLILPRWKTAIFVNGCFWHRHPGCKLATVPKSNAAFWRLKFRNNQRRDISNYGLLNKMGWRVIILWQCEVKTVEAATTALEPHFWALPTP
jgi:DNA mismatch endonuclease (patch repair protein)